MSAFDPEKNLVPLALLEIANQHILKDWPYGVEFYSFVDMRWKSLGKAAWCSGTVYRGKKKPERLTTWSPIYRSGRTGFAYKSHKDAVDSAELKELISVLRLDIIDGVASTTVEDLKR